MTLLLALAAQTTGLALGLAASLVLAFEAFPGLQRLSMRIPYIRRLYAGYFAIGWVGRETRERLVIPDLHPGVPGPDSPPIEYDTWRLKKDSPGFNEMLLVLLGAVEHLRSLGIDAPEIPRPEEILHVRRPEGIVISSTLFRDEGIYLVYRPDTGGTPYVRLRYDYETLGTMVEHREKAYLTRLGLIQLALSVVLQAFALVA